MRNTKSKGIFSILLAIAILSCSLFTGIGGMLATAADEATVDYSTFTEDANTLHPNLSHYEQFGMFTALGIRLQDGMIIMNGDWNWDIATLENQIEKQNAYAVYNIEKGTAFSATFAESTNISEMKFYASDDAVEWYLADIMVSDKTVTLSSSSAWAEYIKIVWPLDAPSTYGLQSVTYTKAALKDNQVRINYANNGLMCYSQTGLKLQNGTVQIDGSVLGGKTTANSYDGHIVYKVQPGTRFALNATSTRGTMNDSGVIARPIDNAAIALGYAEDNVLDFTVTLYGSTDGVNYAPLDVECTHSAAYANFQHNASDWKSNKTRRSTDYNFIVPEGIIYIKCKMPVTQALNSTDPQAWPWSGNDLFEINGVEYTPLKYDYTKNGDALTVDNKAQYGIETYNNIAHGTNGMKINNGRTLKSFVEYKVLPGTSFTAVFKTIWHPNVKNYCTQRDYVLKLQGSNNGVDWTDISNLTFAQGTTSDEVKGKTYSLTANSEQNNYTKIRVFWPDKVNDSYTPHDTFGLVNVAFTEGEKSVAYDFTKVTSAITPEELVRNYGVLNASTTFSQNKDSANKYYGIGIGWFASSVSKAWLTYRVNSGEKVTVTVNENTYYTTPANASVNDDINYNIKLLTSATSDFANPTETIVSDFNANNNSITSITVPDGHKYLKILYPQTNYLPDGKCPNEMFRLQKVEITSATARYNFKSHGLVGDLGTSDEINNLIGAVDWSKDNVPNLQPNGIYGNWSRYNSVGHNIGKPYVTWAVEGGQIATVYLNNADSNNIYGDVQILTSDTMDFAEFESHTVNEVLGDYSVTLTIPKGHKYLKVVLPQDIRYIADTNPGHDYYKILGVDINNERIVISKPTSAETEETREVYINDELGEAPIINVNFSDNTVRRTDCGIDFEGFNNKVLGEQNVTVKYGDLVTSLPVNVVVKAGDFNCDKNVDILDLVRMKKILANITETEGSPVDINKDNEENGTDLAVLTEMILGKIDVFFLNDYSFYGLVAKDTLNNYLDHAVTYSLINTVDRTPSGAKKFSQTHFDEAIRFITNTGAKYVQRAAGPWYPTTEEIATVKALKNPIAAAHKIDADIVFEAAIFETAQNNLRHIAIPSYVFEAFGQPVVERNFVPENMYIDDRKIKIDNDHLGSVYTPDITTLEAQMYYYYMATTYIDVGFEALHLGQMGKVAKYDTDNQCLTRVVNMIRDYAKTHSRRGYVILNSHCGAAQYVAYGTENTMLWDMIVSPSRIHASETAFQAAATENDPQEVKIDPAYWNGNVVYNSPDLDETFTSPSGWVSTENYPYLVEIDNYSYKAEDIGKPNVLVWGRDEYSWYINQPKSYRETFMNYITDTIHGYNENGHACLVGYRGGTFYSNYNSDSCPNGVGDEDAIKAIFAK